MMRRRLPHLLAVTVLAACLAPPAAAEDKLARKLERAAEVCGDLIDMEEPEIPSRLLDDAACIAVIPAVIKGALGWGGRHGRGVLSCRDAGRRRHRRPPQRRGLRLRQVARSLRRGLPRRRPPGGPPQVQRALLRQADLAGGHPLRAQGAAALLRGAGVQAGLAVAVYEDSISAGRTKPIGCFFD